MLAGCYDVRGVVYLDRERLEVRQAHLIVM